MNSRQSGTFRRGSSTNDASATVLVLKNIKNPQKIKNAISQTVDIVRKNAGIRVSEVIGDADPR